MAAPRVPSPIKTGSQGLVASPIKLLTLEQVLALMSNEQNPGRDASYWVVAEDSIINQKTITRLLVKMISSGAKPAYLIIVPNGEEALSICECAVTNLKRNVDVLISDNSMGAGMDGVELCARVRELEDHHLEGLALNAEGVGLRNDELSRTYFVGWSADATAPDFKRHNALLDKKGNTLQSLRLVLAEGLYYQRPRFEGHVREVPMASPPGQSPLPPMLPEAPEEGSRNQTAPVPRVNTLPVDEMMSRESSAAAAGMISQIPTVPVVPAPVPVPSPSLSPSPVAPSQASAAAEASSSSSSSSGPPSSEPSASPVVAKVSLDNQMRDLSLREQGRLLGLSSSNIFGGIRQQSSTKTAPEIVMAAEPEAISPPHNPSGVPAAQSAVAGAVPEGIPVVLPVVPPRPRSPGH